MKNPFISRVLPFVLLFGWTGSALAEKLPNKFALSLKTGQLNLVEDSQVLAGSTRTFDDTSNIWAVEGEWRALGENISFGGEILHYNNRFKRVSTPGSNFEDKMETHSLFLRSKYYFGPSEYWQPYVGFGMGYMTAFDWSGPIEGEANGVGLQGLVGMQFRSERIGFRVEYLYLHGKLDDDKGDKVNVSSRGVMFGMTFYFGRKPQ